MASAYNEVRMHIGKAAAESGLPVKTIRYYEDIGLVTSSRARNGYRQYSSQEVHKLRFLQRARRLGFSVANCRALLSLYDDKRRASAEVKKIAQNHLIEIESRISELQDLRRVLTELTDCCAGDDRPDCPIIDGLAGKNPKCKHVF